MEKEKGLASGEVFLRLETSAPSLSRPTEPQAGIAAGSGPHSTGSTSGAAESGSLMLVYESITLASPSHTTVNESNTTGLHLTSLQSSGSNAAISVANPVASVTNTAASHLIHGRAVSLFSISTTFLTPMPSITR
jgi:hypothetical protein